MSAFIKWGKGVCPVDPETLVYVKYSNGDFSLNAFAASKLNWGDNEDGVHITHYRVVSDTELSAMGYTHKPKPEYTGKSVSYYKVEITHPVSGQNPYLAECQDIIEALGMDFNEGNALKALWRRAAARTLGKAKKGYDNGLYDAEKIVYAGNRLVELSKRNLDEN